MRRLLRRARGALGLLVMGACGAPGLDAVQADIDRALPDVPQIGAEAALTGDPLILDVRTPEEFAVSHLEGAARVDPETSAAAVLAAHPDAATRPVLLYCSVGWRSSLMADRLRAAGVDARNLRGGVFGWRNEGRALVRNGQPTGDVHPYDEAWGRLIEDEAARVFRAGEGSAPGQRAAHLPPRS